jgi:plastocyanin
MVRFVLALVICLFSLTSQAGTVRGEISLSALETLPHQGQADKHFWQLGPKANAAANRPTALVVLESPTATNLAQTEAAAATMTMAGYGLWPQVAVVRVGLSMTFRNTDAHAYSCRAEGGPDAFALKELKPGQTQEHKFLTAGILQVRCHAYPFMRATILAIESPLMATAGGDGKFQLKNVPAGKYTAKVYAAGSWHWKSQVHVAAAGPTLLKLGPKSAKPSGKDSVEGTDALPSPADIASPPIDQKPPLADTPKPGPDPKPPVVDKKPPVTDKKPPIADKKPPVRKKPPVGKKPPAGKKPPVGKKPPGGKKPPVGKKPPTRRKLPAADPEPAFKDVEPEIEIEIED